MKQARDPFASMGMMGFDDDDDFFGGGFGGGMGGGMSHHGMGGGMGGMSSFQSSSFGMGGMGGMGESISQQTIIENGRQKTVTTKTRIDQNGNQTKEVIEEYQDPRTGQHIQNQYIENG